MARTEEINVLVATLSKKGEEIYEQEMKISLGNQLKRKTANGKNDCNGIIARNVYEYTKQPK